MGIVESTIYGYWAAALEVDKPSLPNRFVLFVERIVVVLECFHGLKRIQRRSVSSTSSQALHAVLGVVRSIHNSSHNLERTCFVELGH